MFEISSKMSHFDFSSKLIAANEVRGSSEARNCLSATSEFCKQGGQTYPPKKRKFVYSLRLLSSRFARTSFAAINLDEKSKCDIFYDILNVVLCSKL